MRKKSNIWLVVLLAAVSLGLACGGQEDEANKLVNEANVLITKNNELITKSNALNTQLMGGEVLSKVEDMEKYKTDNKAKFDELISLSEQLEKNKNEAAAKFDQASKMKVDDKFKEYATLNAQELRKRAEIDKADVAFFKAFLAEKDVEKGDKLIEESNKKNTDLKKEADEIMAKSEKLIKDNPNVFKKQ